MKAHNIHKERITYQDNEGNWTRTSYDKQGNKVACRTSGGYWVVMTYDIFGNELTVKDSNGYCLENNKETE